MRFFVTGGTGLLGNTVIRQLCRDGDSVAALVRSDPDPAVFEGLDLERVWSPLVPEAAAPDRSESQPNADPSDEDAPDAIDRAIADCDCVIHSAALIHLGWRQRETSLRVNRDGTRRIVQACLRHDKKLVLIGTVNVLAVGSPQTVADEQTPRDHAGGQVECSYVLSKRAAVDEVNRGVADGLQAVIVHPGFMLGPWDWKPSSGRMMLELSRGWKPLAPSGGCSLCDARDVAAGVVSAARRSLPSGRQYILAGHNWDYHRLGSEMARRMQSRPPMRRAGPGIQYLAGLAGRSRRTTLAAAAFP